MENTNPNPTQPAAEEDNLSAAYEAYSKAFAPEARKASEEEVREETRQQMTWGDTLGESASAVGNGFLEFGQAAATPLMNSLSSSKAQPFEAQSSPKEYTATGSLTNAIAQQLPALIPATKIASLGRTAWASSSVIGSRLAASGLGKLAAAAVADFGSAAAAFDGHEVKLADSLAPIFKDSALGSTFEMLKTDPTGSESMNRFRNGIDNMGMGMAMSGVLKGVGILGRRMFARQAGVAAETVAETFKADIVQLRSENPHVSRLVDEAMKANPDLSEEAAFTAIMATNAKFASEGNTTSEALAKRLTFARGDNEAKAEVVDAALKVDQEFQDFYAAHGHRLEAEQKLANPTHVGPSGEPLITPPPHDPDRRLFDAWRKSEGVVQPSSGEVLVTPPPKQPIGLLPAPVELETDKFLRENMPKVEPKDVSTQNVMDTRGRVPSEELQAKPGDVPAEPKPDAPVAAQEPDEGPDALAQLWPLKGNVARATAGLEPLDRQVFHMARVHIAGADDIPTAKQLASYLKASGTAMKTTDAEGQALKAKLRKMTPAQAEDMLGRFEAYYDNRKSVPVTQADVTAIKPKAEVIDLNGEAKTVQTYNVQGVRIHAEHVEGGKYALSMSLPDQKLVDGEVRSRPRTIDLQKRVDRAGLQQAIAEAAQQSQRYFKLGADGKAQGWAQVVDGRGVIGLFKTSNVSTIVHELTHAYDLLGVAPEFMARMRTSLGFAAEDRSKAAAEAVAETLERFAYRGDLDHAWQKPGLQKLSQFLSAVYKDVEKTPIGMEITEPVRMAFRGMGGVAAMADNVGVRPELAQLKENLLATDFNDPEARQAIFDKATETHLNLSTIEGTDAQTVFKQMQDTFDHVIKNDRGNVETFKDALDHAKGMMLSMGGSPDTLVTMTQGAEHLRGISGQFLYWRGMTQSWADQVAKTLKDVRASPDDLGLQKQFEVAFDSFTRMRTMQADITTEAARLLNKHKIVMPSVPIDPKLAGVGYKELMAADEKSGGKLLGEFATLLEGAKGDPSKIANVDGVIRRRVSDPNLTGLLKTYYTSNILSHPRVMFGTQILAGLTQSVIKPAQYVVGGLATIDRESVRLGLDTYKNLFHTLLDMAQFGAAGADAEGTKAMQGIFETFKNGASVSEHDSMTFIQPSDVFDISGTTKQLANGAWAATTAPMRTMTTLDEFWRQLYGRSYLRSRGMAEAYKQGLSHSSPEFEGVVKKFVDRAFDGTSIVDAQTIRELQDFTFKRPLQDSANPIVRGLGSISNLPIVWLFQPFMRTPINIGREAAMSIPGIGFMSSQMRAGFFSSNPQIAAAFRGRQIMGGAALGLFGMMAYNGNITGSGPDSSTEKGKQWYAAGYRPYSFVYHNSDGTVTSIGYQQMESFGSIAGLCANLVEGLDQSDVPDDKKTAAAWAVAASLGKTWTDKRYLMGLQTMLKFANGDAASARQAMAQIAAGFIPLSGAQSFVSDITGDEDVKHAQGLVAQIQNRTLFKTALEPKRDFFGKPIEGNLWANLSPAPVKTSSADPVVGELVNLEGRVTNGFGEKLRGIDLSEYRNAKGQSAYDRRMELRQEVKHGKYTLHDALGRVISSKSYQRLAQSDIPDMKVQRAQMLMNVVEQYNATIQTQLLKEYPDLKRAYFAADPMAKRQQSGKNVASALMSIPK